MDELANPFLDQTKELVTIDSQHVMPQNVVENLEQIQSRLETKGNDSTEFTCAFPQTEACEYIQGQEQNHVTEE